MPTSSSSTRSTCLELRRSMRASTSCATSAWNSALGAALLIACHGAPVEPPDAATSPQASAEPAPLANVPAAGSATATAASLLDGGPPPEPLRSDRELPADSPHETIHELGAKEPPRDPKEMAGYELLVV